MKLYAEVDDGEGPPLLLLHGFTGSIRSWDELRPDLSKSARCLAVDLPGHGRSPSPPDVDAYSVSRCVHDLLDVLDAHAISRTAVLGYSMGGRVALHLALAAAERVPALLLESASPGIEDSAERAQRVAADEDLARVLEREGVQAFVDRWEQVPLLALGPHVSDQSRARLRRIRLANTAVGLANSLRGMGAGAQASLWPRVPELRMPVLLLVGQRDVTYRAFAERMRSQLRSAELVVVPRAGHTVHVDQPGAFEEAVTRFLAEQAV